MSFSEIVPSPPLIKKMTRPYIYIYNHHPSCPNYQLSKSYVMHNEGIMFIYMGCTSLILVGRYDIQILMVNSKYYLFSITYVKSGRIFQNNSNILNSVTGRGIMPITHSVFGDMALITHLASPRVLWCHVTSDFTYYLLIIKLYLSKDILKYT